MKNKKMKILFLSNRNPFPMIDGQSTRTYNILKGLAEKHDVYLLSLNESPYEIDFINLRHLKGFCKNVEMIQAPYKKIGFSMIVRLLLSLFSFKPYTIWRHYSKVFLKRVRQVVKITKFDLIHCDILPLSYAIENIKQIPCVITDHDVSYLKALRMATNTHNIFLKLFLFLESLKLKGLERNVFKHVKVGILVSATDKQYLKRLCPEGNFQVLENGVDTDKFYPFHDRIEDNTLLWIGGFEYHPNEEAIYFFLDKIYPLIMVNRNPSGIVPRISPMTYGIF